MYVCKRMQQIRSRSDGFLRCARVKPRALTTFTLFVRLLLARPERVAARWRGRLPRLAAVSSEPPGRNDSLAAPQHT